MVGIHVGTIATDTTTLSRVTIKNEAAQTSLGCSQETKTEKERQQSRGYRNPRTGSLHQPDFINEQPAGDIDQVSKSGKVLGVSWRGRLDQYGPYLVGFIG